MASLSKQQVLDIIAKAPPGTSPAGVVSALRSEGHTLEGYPDQGTYVKAHVRASRGTSDLARGLTQGVAGGVGGAYGGPVGAGVAGGLTEALSQAAEMGAPAGTMGIPTYDPGAVLRAAGTQGAFEAGGRLLGGIPGKVLAPASRKVAAMLAARSENVVRAADQAGTVINVGKAADEALAPFVKRAQAAGGDAVAALEKFRDNFLGNKAVMSLGPGAQTTISSPSEAHAAKEYYDSLSRAIRDAAQKPGPAEKLVAQYAKRLGDKLRAELVSQVPGYGKAMAAESSNLAAKRAIQTAARPIAYIGTAAAAHETPGIKELPWYIKYGVIPGVAQHFANPAMVANIADVATNPALALWLQGSLANLGRGTQAVAQSGQ